MGVESEIGQVPIVDFDFFDNLTKTVGPLLTVD